jgi:CO/xanthine dehydrogenase FAD-binding subunit
MKPAAFEYFAPGGVNEAVTLLERYEDEAKILAGGQSLIPIMNFRLGRPSVLIDINGLRQLDYIKEEGSELVIGALTRERALEQSLIIRRKCPLLSAAVSHIGHVSIRNRGTIGGSLVHADPSAEIPTALCALEAEMKAVGPDGERHLTSEAFFLTYLTTSLEPTEILVEVRIPVPPEGSGWSFQELSRRRGDFAIVAVASVLYMDGDKRCREARISLGGVAPTPVRAEEAEGIFSGAEITEALIEEAGRLAVKATDAESDYHASADYRRDMTRVLVKRSLTEAWKRALGGE